MTNRIVRWGTTGDQVEPVGAKKDGGSNAGKPEAAEYINWLFSRMAAGANMDRDENALLRLPLINSLAFKHGVGSATFARSTIGTYIDRYGVLQTAAIDEPRFEAEGYLTEGEGTNLAFRSDDFNNAYWTKVQSSITPNDTTAPDGVAASADLFVESSNFALHSVNRDIATSDATVLNTLTVFAKANVRTELALRMDSGGSAGVRAFFDLVSGVVILTDSPGAGSNESAKITALADGWYRCELNGIPDNGGTTVTTEIGPAVGDSSNYQGTGADSVWIWGAQCEELPFASSYIATVAAAVTRTIDSLLITYTDNLLEPDQSCSMFIDFDAIGFIGSAPRLFSTVGETNREIFAVDSELRVSWNTSQQLRALVAVPLNTQQRVGVRFDGSNSDLSIWVDGDEKNALTRTAEVGGIATSISLGQNGVGAAPWYGHIKNLRIYDHAFSDEEMSVA